MHEPITVPWIRCEDCMPPKQHTVLAVYCEERNDYSTAFKYKKKLYRTVVRAHWIPKFSVEDEDNEFSGDPDYDEAKDMYYWPEGWYEHNEQEETSWKLSGKITHWVWLPALPEIQQSQSSPLPTPPTEVSTPA